MRFQTLFSALALTAVMSSAGAQPPPTANVRALTGLAPFSLLDNTQAGQAALAANYQVTSDIQTGAAKQDLLLPFAAQQDQALKDAYITFTNATELADGLGTKLGGAYHAKAKCTGTDDGGKATVCTNIGPAVAKLILYTATLTASDSNAGKYFFADAMSKIGKAKATKAPADEIAILTAIGGKTDMYGKAYTYRPPGITPDKYGDPRPFQTEKTLVLFKDADYFGLLKSNADYLYGAKAVQPLEQSPAWPSGHTTYGYTESLLLAILVPQRYPQMITRAAEYGNDRIVLGAHYAMDVIAGRALAEYDVAQTLAGKHGYVGQTEAKVKINNYATALAAAKTEMTTALTAGCGESITACAAADSSRFASPAADEAFYEETQTYGLPVVYPANAGKVEDVAAKAPEAGYLLTAAFPKLTLAQADAILTSTEGPGGGFLDDGSAFGIYSRLDLYRAALQAEAAP